jgi:hypothetical protein
MLGGNLTEKKIQQTKNEQQNDRQHANASQNKKN